MSRLTVRLTAKETAEKLSFTTTNLKHYASLLEQNGHKIFRNTRNHREYSLHDVDLLTAMKILNRDKSMLLEEAASLVMSEDTDLQAILQLSKERIDANIRVVAQEVDANMPELSAINVFLNEMNLREQEQLQLLKSINDQLLTQTEENKMLREELANIKMELQTIKQLKLEEDVMQKREFLEKNFH